MRDEFARDCGVNGGYLVQRVALNQLRHPDEIEARDEKTAMAVFKRERSKFRERIAAIEAKGEKRSPWDSGGYSNISGEFALDEPMRVAAILPGLEDNVIRRVRGEAQTLAPCTYIVYESKNNKETDRPHEWYQQALEIVVEMCEWVLAQPDVAMYRLAWSG